jgi:acetyl esterase/lipase
VAATRGPQQLPRYFAELDAWADEHALPVETLAYGSDEDNVVDLREAAAMPLGTALVVHGGFWRAEFTRTTTSALATALAHAGWRTANVEYRRLGPGRYRELLDDVAAAAAAVEPDVAIGHSAGGHLSLWLAGRGLAGAAVGLAAVCDLTAAAEAGIGDDAVREFLGGGPQEAPAAYDDADPARRLPLGVRQVLVHGTRDDRVPLALAARYAAAARAAGDDCRMIELADADHFDVIDPRYGRFTEITAAMPR